MNFDVVNSLEIRLSKMLQYVDVPHVVIEISQKMYKTHFLKIIKSYLESVSKMNQISFHRLNIDNLKVLFLTKMQFLSFEISQNHNLDNLECLELKY